MSLSTVSFTLYHCMQHVCFKADATKGKRKTPWFLTYVNVQQKL